MSTNTGIHICTHAMQTVRPLRTHQHTDVHRCIYTHCHQFRDPTTDTLGHKNKHTKTRKPIQRLIFWVSFYSLLPSFFFCFPLCLLSFPSQSSALPCLTSQSPLWGGGGGRRTSLRKDKTEPNKRPVHPQELDLLVLWLPPLPPCALA